MVDMIDIVDQPDNESVNSVGTDFKILIIMNIGLIAKTILDNYVRSYFLLDQYYRLSMILTSCRYFLLDQYYSFFL